jgi:GntR family transcriptional regulator
LTKNETFPRYADIANQLEREISTLGPNSLLATEEQLAQRCSVSRVTVRSALDLLERSGLVSRLRGRGTVVSPPKVTRRFSPLYSFEKDLASQGIKFGTKVISFSDQAEPPAEIRERLQLPRNARVGHLSLVRIVDDRIICHNDRYYPSRIARKIQPQQIETRDSADVLEEMVGQPIVGVKWESEIVPVSAEIADALEVASRTLVFANTYTWLIADGTPVEAGIVSYRIDRCKFKYEIDFNRPGTESAGTLVPFKVSL